MSTRISKTDTADVALYEKVNEIADGIDGQVGYRKANTEYAVETVRACAYHPEFQLKCTTAGTTGSGELDTSGSYNEGDKIEDGTVVWEITTVGSGSGGAALPLLSYNWYDHKLYDASFLRADTFSWHEGDIYKAVYEHLLAEWKDTTVSSNWLTEVVEDVTITYQLAEDGHKICAPDQEYKIRELYEKCGVAWYYILDTENKKFKLPRKVSDTLDLTTSPVVADLSGIGYKETSEHKYLYFYVGNTLRKKSEIDLGVLMELLETVQQPTITYWE